MITYLRRRYTGSSAGVIANNMIIYEASAKLFETTSNKPSTGLHVNAFSGKSGKLTITSHTFSNGSGVIEFSGDVTSIGNYAFYTCFDLTSVTIPNSVTSIGSSVFYFCGNLYSITCNATTAPTITSGTFMNVSTNGTLYVPIGSTGYDTWMGTGNYYLGKYNWTKIEQ